MELEAEAAGINYSEYQSEATSASSTAAAKKKAASALKAEQEKQKMATIMMSKKDRQLYSSIRQEQVKKEAKVGILHLFTIIIIVRNSNISHCIGSTITTQERCTTSKTINHPLYGLIASIEHKSGLRILNVVII
jgi:hypothetical protein